MPSTHTSLEYHIIFSTKYRERTIRREWRDDLHRYLGGCIRKLGGVASEVGGTDDHVHIAAGLRPTHCVSQVLCDIKRASSVWVKDNFDSSFAWQEGYGAVTLRRSELPELRRYIANQEEHHRSATFQEEYRDFLQVYGIEFDEQFLW